MVYIGLVSLLARKHTFSSAGTSNPALRAVTWASANHPSVTLVNGLNIHLFVQWYLAYTCLCIVFRVDSYLRGDNILYVVKCVYASYSQ